MSLRYGASVNIMPMVIYEELQYRALSPTYMAVQLADSMIRYPKGIVKNILVRVRDSFVLANFVVMDRGRPRSGAHSWVTIPEGRQSKDRRRKRRNPLPCRNGGYVFQVQAQGRATLPDIAGQRRASILGCTITPARTPTHHS